MSGTAIWWIRRDLRLADNAALNMALAEGPSVLPVFVLDPVLLKSAYSSEKRIAFMLGGLRALDAELRARGSHLIVRYGDPVTVLKTLLAETGADVIVAETDYSPYAAARDERVATGLPVQYVEGLAVYPPGSVVKADGTPYTVFTPFSKRWKANGLPTRHELLPVPDRITTPHEVTGVPLPDEPALPDTVPFVPGEAAALARLDAFTDGDIPQIYAYQEERNRMDLAGTSGLSPYLRFGMISARQAVVRAAEMMESAPDGNACKSAETFLNELIWREFFIHILAHFPTVSMMSFRENLRHIPWEHDVQTFSAWQAGQTGYPVVDAAIRQLLVTGWMHNRARMIVASFLTKDLLIDWRWGEQHFMQHLVDGDIAANNGGWQWAAGTGTDAAPYFRIFNPVTQGQKFDPDGVYIRRWVPELANVPVEYIQEPWRMPPLEQRAAGCVIGEDYPAPIVDHNAARQRALAAYGAAKDSA